MKIVIPVVLTLIALLTVGIAGDWIVDNVSISQRLSQTEPAVTNAVMGALGVGTAAPTAKLHVVGTARIEGTMDLTDHRIVNLALPVSPGDAASKGYVQSALENITPSGGISMGIYTNR